MLLRRLGLARDVEDLTVGAADHRDLDGSDVREIERAGGGELAEIEVDGAPGRQVGQALQGGRAEMPSGVAEFHLDRVVAPGVRPAKGETQVGVWPEIARLWEGTADHDPARPGIRPGRHHAADVVAEGERVAMTPGHGLPRRCRDHHGREPVVGLEDLTRGRLEVVEDVHAPPSPHALDHACPARPVVRSSASAVRMAKTGSDEPRARNHDAVLSDGSRDSTGQPGSHDARKLTRRGSSRRNFPWKQRSPGRRAARGARW